MFELKKSDARKSLTTVSRLRFSPAQLRNRFRQPNPGRAPRHCLNEMITKVDNVPVTGGIGWIA
jgi:hypothetical protein